jgi:Uma2 family endonuclease
MSTQPTTAPLVSAEEYLSTNYRPDCEYNEGVLEERNLGEFDHSFLQTILAALFTNQIANWGVFGLVEQRVKLRPNRYLVPDVCVLRMGTPREPILTRPPLVTIELMSPKDTLRDVAKKSIEYLEFGVEHVWVIDPRDKQERKNNSKRAAYRGTMAGLELVSSGELTVPGTPIRVNVIELFEKLDQF